MSAVGTAEPGRYRLYRFEAVLTSWRFASDTRICTLSGVHECSKHGYHQPLLRALASGRRCGGSGFSPAHRTHLISFGVYGLIFLDASVYRSSPALSLPFVGVGCGCCQLTPVCTLSRSWVRHLRGDDFIHTRVPCVHPTTLISWCVLLRLAESMPACWAGSRDP